MTSALFTIIIPYKNRAGHLPDTLTSLLQLTSRPLQVILVDNRSTDESPALCRSFRDQCTTSSNGITVTLLSQPTGGACHARNLGLSQVKTPYVYFFDSDDRFTPDFFEHVSTALQEDASRHPERQVDMVTLTTQLAFPDGRCRCRCPRPSLSPVDQILTGMLSTQSMVFRTAFLRSLGGWNEDTWIWNDWELGLRCLLHHPTMVTLPQKHFHHILQHADSITGSRFGLKKQEIIHTMNVAEGMLQEYPALRNAMDGRRLILAGHLHHEGDTAASRQLKHEVMDRHGKSFKWKIFSTYCFTCRKAAWRLYKLLFPCYEKNWFHP